MYIIQNDAFDGLVKVGFSRCSGQRRAADLNRERGTGTPGRFVCVWQHWTDTCVGLERAAHDALRDMWVDKEWFRCSVECAKAAILAASPQLVIPPKKYRRLEFERLVHIEPGRSGGRLGDFWGVVTIALCATLFLKACT